MSWRVGDRSLRWGERIAEVGEDGWVEDAGVVSSWAVGAGSGPVGMGTARELSGVSLASFFDMGSGREQDMCGSRKWTMTGIYIYYKKTRSACLTRNDRKSNSKCNDLSIYDGDCC